MTRHRIGQLLVCAMLACACVAVSRAGDKPSDKFPTYETTYYTIHTDLDKDRLREAEARLLPMAEDYYRRVQQFAGGRRITKKLPIYLFSKEEDYHASGGPAAAKGNFNGVSMNSWVPDGENADIGWKNVQHECFHQFVHTFVTDNLPPWLNEGIAVYYAEAIWTGDGYVAGGIPSVRVKDIQQRIKDKQTIPVMKFVAMTQQQYLKLSGEEFEQVYNQAWSMVYFLMHADNGKYQKALNDYIADIVAGKGVEASFVARFGRDGGPLGKPYEKWWLTLPDEPSPEVYAQATVAILTSFLARATASGMKFKDVNEFFDLAKADKLENTTGQWLPDVLLKRSVGEALAEKEWRWLLENPAGKKVPRLTLKTPDGTLYTGTFQVVGKKAVKVEVKVTKAKTPTSGPRIREPADKEVPSTADQLKKAQDKLHGFHPPPGE